MLKFLKQKNKFKKAFTLVEVLVAIAIFSASILAMMSVLAGGITDTNFVKNKMIATYLAQEGIEAVRNMRDTAVLSGIANSKDGWIDFYSSVNSCTNIYCSFSSPTQLSSLQPCLKGGDFQSCPALFLNSTGDYSVTPIGTNSGFIRGIKNIPMVYNSNNGGNEVQISSTVAWSKGSVTLSENLFNWVEQ